MTFIKFIFFCLFFNRITDQWPLMAQKDMFYLAEKNKTIIRKFPRAAGVTTFMTVYSFWKAGWNKYHKVIHITNKYGVDKSRGLGIFAPDYENLLTVNATTAYGFDELKGRYADIVLKDNESVNDTVILPIIKISQKYVFFFTL